MQPWQVGATIAQQLTKRNSAEAPQSAASASSNGGVPNNTQLPAGISFEAAAGLFPIVNKAFTSLMTRISACSVSRSSQELANFYRLLDSARPRMGFGVNMRQVVAYPLMSGVMRQRIEDALVKCQRVMPVPSAASYYVAFSGKPIKVNLGDMPAMVRQGQLTLQSLVWTKGLSGWTPASQVRELAGLFRRGTPAAPAAPPVLPAVAPPPSGRRLGPDRGCGPGGGTKATSRAAMTTLLVHPKFIEDPIGSMCFKRRAKIGPGGLQYR